MQGYDLVVQLGSQVMYVDGQYKLAPHTLMRTEASAILLKKGITPRLMVLGGSNFDVRYDNDKIFGATHPTQKTPIFTFEAFAGSDYNRKSEAAVIKDALVERLGVPFSKKILAETLSSTTEENAAFLAIILKRRPMFTGNEKIGILTLLYHMNGQFDKEGKKKPGALEIFHKAGLNVEPIFAENMLVLDANRKNQQTERDIFLGDDPVTAYQIDDICQYYSTPKGGKQYDVDRIRQLLTEGKSLAEMLR